MTGQLLHVATRKGLFVVEGSGADARIVAEHFVGDNVPLTCTDPRDGAWYAVLDHGHFGVKLHRSDDGGTTWVVQSIDPAAGSQASWTSAGTPGFPGLDVATTFREVELGVGYRLNCIVFSNGPINYRMSTTSPAPSAWGIFP